MVPRRKIRSNTYTVLRFIKALVIKTRLKLNFWQWPIEVRLLKFLRTLYSNYRATKNANAH